MRGGAGNFGVATALEYRLHPVNQIYGGIVFFLVQRRRVETQMVLAGEATPSRVELPLLKAVARVRRWALELISGQVNSVDEIARREHLDKRSVRRLLRLGFLSPRIIEAIAEGHQPPDLPVFSLMRRVDLPLLWNAQEQAFGLR